jgi:hypothetical protein
MNRLCSTNRASWNGYKVRQGSLLLWSPNCGSCYNTLLICTLEMPFPVAAPSKMSVCSLLLSAIGLSNFAGGYGCLSLASDGCCQVKVSAKDRSLVQRISTECDLETSTMRKSRPNRVFQAWKKKNFKNWCRNVYCIQAAKTGGNSINCPADYSPLEYILLDSPCSLLKREAADVSRTLIPTLMIDKEWNPRKFETSSTRLREPQIPE